MSSNKSTEKFILGLFEKLRLLIEDFSKKYAQVRDEISTMRSACRNDLRMYDDKKHELVVLGAWLKEFDAHSKMIGSLLDSIRHEDSYIDDIYDYLAAGPIEHTQDSSFDRKNMKSRIFKEEKQIECNESFNYMEAFVPFDHNPHEFEPTHCDAQISVRKSARIIEKLDEQRNSSVQNYALRNRISNNKTNIVIRERQKAQQRQAKSHPYLKVNTDTGNIYNEYDDEKLMMGALNSSDIFMEPEFYRSQNSSLIEMETSAESSPAKIEKKKVKRPRGGYTRWSEEFKAKIIQEVQMKKADINEISKSKGVPKKNIGRWLKFGPQRKKGGGRKTQDPAMEINLKRWVDIYVENHKLFPQRCMIKNQARRLSKVEKFKASKGWLDKFLKRTGLDKVMRQYQIPIEEELGLLHFARKTLKQLSDQGSSSNQQASQINQTGGPQIGQSEIFLEDDNSEEKVKLETLCKTL